MSFEDRVALVTGSARGIGKAIAAKLLERGATVAVVDLDRGDVDSACSQLAENGAADRVAGFTCNVSQPEDVIALFKDVKQTFGRLDILVNNAGITRDNLFLRMTLEQWQSVIDVNLTGTFLCCRYGAPLLRKSPAGRIVNISSVTRNGNPGQANYASSKAGVVGLTKTLALELARYGVTCNAVAPGFIETEMTRTLPDEIRAAWVSKIPAGRAGTEDDVADVVTFLASDAASYVTGDVLGVDGGMHA